VKFVSVKAAYSADVAKKWLASDYERYRSFAVAVIVRAGGLVLSLVCSILTARGLGASERGVLYTCTAAAAMAAQLLLFGMPSSAGLVVAARPSLARRAIGRGLGASIISVIVCLAAVPLTRAVGLGRFVSPEIVRYAVSVGALVGTQVLLAWCTMVMQGVGAVEAIPVLEFIHRAAAVIWTWITLFVLRMGVEQFLVALVILDSLYALGWAAYILVLAPDRKGRPETWPSAWWRVSITAYPVFLLGNASRRIDFMLLTGLSGARATGIYSVATQVMDALMIGATFLAQRAFFEFGSGRGASPSMRRLRVVTPAAILLGMIVAGATANRWCPQIFGKDFTGLTPVMLALAVGATSYGWSSIAEQEMNAQGYPLSLSLLWLVTLCGAAGTMIVCIPRFGATGAALGFTVGYGLHAVGLKYLIYKLRQTDARPLMFTIEADRDTQPPSIRSAFAE
jgi:O-antigen/teichoic acid export membrane protein